MRTNLVDIPWIPLATGNPDQPLITVGIREALIQAHHYQPIAAPSPLATVMLERLLLVILHRAYDGPVSMPEVRAMWQSRRFDAARIDAYLTRWHDRFDLLDPTHPFLQTPGLRDRAKSAYLKPGAYLFPERASERAQGTVFDQSQPDDVVSLAEWVWGLLLAQGYSVGGLVSFDEAGNRSATAAPLVNGAVWTVAGGTLWEMLMRNLLPWDSDAADIPQWERDAASLPAQRMPDGRLDWLTWRARRLLLLPNADGALRVVVMRGDQPPTRPTGLIDPYALIGDDGPLDPGASHPLLLVGASLDRLPVLTWQRQLMEAGIIQVAAVDLHATWFVTNQVRFLAWHRLRFRLPADIVQHADRWQPVMQCADAVVVALRAVLCQAEIRLASGPITSPWKRLAAVAPTQAAQERHDAPDRYHAALAQERRRWLASLTTPDAALTSWLTSAARCCRQAALTSIDRIPTIDRHPDLRQQLTDDLNAAIAAIIEESPRVY